MRWGQSYCRPGGNLPVDAGRLVAVASSAERPSYVARSTVDGAGQFLIPGLMDMHAHLFLPEPAVPTLNLLLANGVTSIREMSGDCWEAAGAREGCIGADRELQKKLQAGEVAGPELVSISSAMVMGPDFAQVPEMDARAGDPAYRADAHRKYVLPAR